MVFENEIICDDFRNIYPHLPRKFTVISDPPYNQDYHYDIYKDKIGDGDYSLMLSAAFDVERSVVIHYPEQMVGIVAPAIGRQPVEIVSWVYPSNTAKQSRLIAWFGFKPDMTADGQPYRNPNDKRIKKLIAKGKKARLYDWWEINQVKNVSKKKKNEPHPCPIPMKLAERLILVSSKPGDLVVDPFVGQGTICVAAKKLGRRYLGIEISPAYVTQSIRALGNV